MDGWFLSRVIKESIVSLWVSNNLDLTSALLKFASPGCKSLANKPAAGISATTRIPFSSASCNTSGETGRPLLKIQLPPIASNCWNCCLTCTGFAAKAIFGATNSVAFNRTTVPLSIKLPPSTATVRIPIRWWYTSCCLPKRLTSSSKVYKYPSPTVQICGFSTVNLELPPTPVATMRPSRSRSVAVTKQLPCTWAIYCTTACSVDNSTVWTITSVKRVVGTVYKVTLP